MSASNHCPITRINRRVARLASPLAVALGLCLTLGSTAARADRGTTLCPGSAIVKLNLDLPSVGSDLLAQDLMPGDTLDTAGTNLGLSPQLQGSVVITELIPFEFNSPTGTVKGTLIQRVVNADDATCDNYWRVVLHPGSAASVKVTGLKITKFTHPAAGLVGDFRNDMVPGGIGSDTVKRSGGLGKTITFAIDTGVGPGQTSRPLFLDTQIGLAKKNGSVQLRTSDGGVSPLFDTYVPYQP